MLVFAWYVIQYCTVLNFSGYLQGYLPMQTPLTTCLREAVKKYLVWTNHKTCPDRAHSKKVCKARSIRFLSKLANKARFARVRAARGWTTLYHGSCIDPTHQSHTLDLTSEAPILRFPLAIQLLIKDNCWQELHFEFSRQNLNRNVQSPSLR